VWRVFLGGSVRQLSHLSATLSADELERAGRFHFERDQKRFILARGMLRQILGHYVGENPQTLRFEYSRFGKPSLAHDAGYGKLCFNLSHSADYALYAITPGRAVGIDIEQVRSDVAIEQVARRFFSPGEVSSIEKLDKGERHEVFFRYWTRKEAFAKAVGEGLSFPLERCDVSSMPGHGLSPIGLMDDDPGDPRWQGQDLFPGTGYVAAIAVEGGDMDLSCWAYPI
jgi:4'-phosphopantetheinyl transferase